MDTKERIKDIITAVAKEDPEAVKAAVHDVLTAKMATRVNPPVEPPVSDDAPTDDLPTAE